MSLIFKGGIKSIISNKLQKGSITISASQRITFLRYLTIFSPIKTDA